MNAPQKICIIAFSCALLSSGVAIYALHELGKSRHAVTATVHERDELRAKLKESGEAVANVNSRLLQAQLDAASLKEDLGRLFPQKSNASAGVPFGPAAARAGAINPASGSLAPPLESRYGASIFVGGRYRGPRTSFVRNPPSARSLDTLYPALYRQLKLSPEQTAGFKTLAIEIAQRFSGIDRQAKSEHKRPSDPTMQPLYAAVDAEYRQKLAALVGIEAIPAIEYFAETLVLREAVVHVASDLFYTDEPLHVSQAERLVEVVSKNLRDPSGRIDTAFADASAMKAAAREFLSPVQLAAWGFLSTTSRRVTSTSFNRVRGLPCVETPLARIGRPPRHRSLNVRL